jgi:tetratricopeptide (TPR) repeat protein
LGLATLLAAAIGFGWFAWTERRRAETNLALARQAVDESLAAVDRDPALVGADVPQVEELRRELLSRAERFYLAFIQQDPRSEAARRELAQGHLRVARISRMLEKREDAEREYRAAIATLTSLIGGSHAAIDRQSLGSAYNSLGETLRVQTGRAKEAEEAYQQAMQIQQALANEHGEVSQYQEDLALTRVNRGILRWDAGDGEVAEGDFRESIRLLDAVGDERARTVQERGRAANNLAGLLDARGDIGAEAFYTRAISGHESLVQRFPQNREYKLELAKFCNNLAVFFHEHGAGTAADTRNRQAVTLLAELSRPAPSLAIERADAHNLRGVLLHAEAHEASHRDYETALDLFADLTTSANVLTMPAFHQRFGDLLINLAALSGGEPSDSGGRLLSRAIEQYLGVAARTADAGDASQARTVIETINRVLPELPQRERQRFASVQERLGRVAARGPS